MRFAALDFTYVAEESVGSLAVPKSGKRIATEHLMAEERPRILYLHDRDRLTIRMFLVLGLRSGAMFVLRRNHK